MEAKVNSAVFDWILRGRRPLPDSDTKGGVPLACAVPLSFERYAKILHRLEGFYDNIDHPLSREELRILNIPACTVLQSLATDRRHTLPGARIFWKEAAAALRVPYTPEITPEWFFTALGAAQLCWARFISGPAEGSLTMEECQELASLLAQATPQKPCFFRLAEIPFVGTEQKLLFEGELNEVADFFSTFQFTPEYWWPSDHQWCVCTDYDLTFTIVGGSSDLISSLLKSRVLECIEIGPGIRIDNLVPPAEDNGRKQALD